MNSPNPPSPEFYQEDLGWVTGYLVVHMMSANSRRYMYALWLGILLLLVVFSILHWTGSRGGFLGARWSKWAIRRRTWRGKHVARIASRTGKPQQPLSLPSNGQLACLMFLPIATFLLCFVGPDYISPKSNVFDLVSRASSSSYNDPNTYVQFQPTYTIEKAWWTAGGRTGLMAFAVFPVCVLFALKAPPFAIFALPFTTQFYSDKLSWLHRWSGRLIWFVTALHVALWSVQLARDTRPNTGTIVYNYAWLYMKFIYGWIAFGCLTLLVLLSFPFLRKPHYETFYIFHVFLVAGTLILSALHHPPVAMWCYATLGIWFCERSYRFLRWTYVNGIVVKADSVQAPPAMPNNHNLYPSHLSGNRPDYPPVSSPYVSKRFSSISAASSIGPSTTLKYTPPPGYAHAELLSGATIRLTYVSPKPLSWAPGQHFLISVPSITMFTTHPFTIASVYDSQAPNQSGRSLVFLVRCKNGWTQDLWHHVAELTYHRQIHPPSERPPKDTILPQHGVIMRMFVDGPFGSAARANWGSHSTVLIVVGGSGVSFGLSILEFVCLCLAGRDGKHLGGRAGGWGSQSFSTRRVRFVWLVREFAHLQWSASCLRRCSDMIPAPGLQIDIYVTNFKPPMYPSLSSAGPSVALLSDAGSEALAPPSRPFAGQPRRPGMISADGFDSDPEVDLSYYEGNYGDEERDVGEPGTVIPNYTVDLTDFDGDREGGLLGEEILNRRVGKVSNVRRAKTLRRRKSLAQPELHQVSNGLPSTPRSVKISRKDRNRISTRSTDGLLTSDWNSSLHREPSEEYDLGGMTPTTYEEEAHLFSPSATSPSSQAPWHMTAPSEHSDTALDPRHLAPPRRERPSTVDDYVNLSRPATPTDRATSPRLALPEASVTAPESEGDQPRLRVDEQELRDVSIVSEFARPGKPRLDRIVADEAEKARGSVVVACCGPESLNAMVRKSIALNIRPERIRRGDKRGYIYLISEDYSY